MVIEIFLCQYLFSADDLGFAAALQAKLEQEKIEGGLSKT